MLVQHDAQEFQAQEDFLSEAQVVPCMTYSLAKLLLGETVEGEINYCVDGKSL